MGGEQIMSKHQTCPNCHSDFVGPDSNIGENLCMHSHIHADCDRELSAFQVGDVVKIISSEERLADIHIFHRPHKGLLGEVVLINYGNSLKLKYRIQFPSGEWWYFDEEDLELVSRLADLNKCKTCKYWSENENDEFKDGFRECTKLEKCKLVYRTGYHLSSYKTHPDFGCFLWKIKLEVT